MLPCLDLFSMDLLLVCMLIYCLNKWNSQLKLQYGCQARRGFSNLDLQDLTLNPLKPQDVQDLTVNPQLNPLHSQLNPPFHSKPCEFTVSLCCNVKAMTILCHNCANKVDLCAIIWNTVRYYKALCIKLLCNMSAMIYPRLIKDSSFCVL